MKKTAIILCALLAMSTACNRDKAKSGTNEVIAKKYCIVNIGVYQTKMQKKAIKWMTRGESLSLLGTEMVTKGNKKYEVSKVKISSGETGYATSKYLGEKPAVFLKDTRTYSSNNKTSRIAGKIPRGTLGFVMEEKGGWVKVYAVYYEKGKRKVIWMQWVKDGYSSDEDLMVDARIYEGIQAMLATAPAKVTEKDIKAREKDIEDLAGKTNMFAELITTSKEELSKLKEKVEELKQQKEEKKPAEDDTKTEKKEETK